MDVAVPATVLIQIQFLQGVVALELTDDAVGLEGDLQLAADLVPAIDILPPQPGDLHDLPEAFRRQDVDDVACPRQDPGDQYRSEERRVGKGGVRTGSTGGVPYH